MATVGWVVVDGRPYADRMSAGPYPLGVAVTWGRPVASSTTRALQPADPRTGIAQTRACRWVEAVGDGWAIADVVPTTSTGAPVTAASDRAERFTNPPRGDIDARRDVEFGHRSGPRGLPTLF